jgi:hypothetical protein
VQLNVILNFTLVKKQQQARKQNNGTTLKLGGEYIISKTCTFVYYLQFQFWWETSRDMNTLSE